MIMPDDDLVCSQKHKDNLGYPAIYNVSEDAELSTGVILAAVIKGIIYLFQIDETTDILNESSVPIMIGSLFEYLEDGSFEEEVDYFPISNCRFPTKEELEWYYGRKIV